MIFRRFHPDDLEVVIELHFAGLDQFNANMGIGPWDDDLKTIHDTYLNDNGDFIVCSIDGLLVGMGALKRHDKKTAEIKRMRVSMQYQRRGIGKTILNLLEQSAKSNGYSRLILDTTINQMPAIKLYEQNGFVEYKRENHHGVETIYFEKELLEERK